MNWLQITWFCQSKRALFGYITFNDEYLDTKTTATWLTLVGFIHISISDWRFWLFIPTAYARIDSCNACNKKTTFLIYSELWITLHFRLSENWFHSHSTYRPLFKIADHLKIEIYLLDVLSYELTIFFQRLQLVCHRVLYFYFFCIVIFNIIFNVIFYLSKNGELVFVAKIRSPFGPIRWPNPISKWIFSLLFLDTHIIWPATDVSKDRDPDQCQ